MTSAIDKKRFVRHCNSLLKALGGEPLVDEWHEWRFQTKYGPLYLSVREETRRNKGPGDVVSQFDDADNAKAATPEIFCGLTGKWNHYYEQEWSAVDAAENFAHLLERILQPKST